MGRRAEHGNPHPVDGITYPPINSSSKMENTNLTYAVIRMPLDNGCLFCPLAQ